MKRSIIWSLAGVCLLSWSCAKHDTEEFSEPKHAAATARLYLTDETTEAEADPASRATFTDGYKIAWETGDQVATADRTAYTVQQDESGRWFVELASAESYTVYYPASSYLEHWGGAMKPLVGTINDAQTYRAGSFDPKTFLARAQAVPGEKLVFKYLSSFVKVTLKGTAAEQVASIGLTTAGLGEEYFCRIGEIDETEGVIKTVGIVSYYCRNVLTLTADNIPLTEEGVDFYMGVFPTTFSQGFQITVTLADGRTMTKKGGVGQTAARGRVLAMPALRFEETDPSSPVYYSTDNVNWRAWKYDTDGVTPTTLAYPETADHMFYFKDNAACATPGLKLAHLQSLHDTFLVNGNARDNVTATSVNPVGFDFSRTTYESTTLPAGVLTRWADSSNQYDLSLQYVSLPKNISIISANAFEGDLVLHKVILPASVSQIGNEAFYLARGFWYSEDGSDLSTQGIFCYATTPPTLGADTFNYCNHYFHVPAASLAAYQTAWAASPSAKPGRSTMVGDL